MVSDDEKQDFLSAITQYGFREKDFELNQHRDPPSGAGIYAITGVITIRYKPNGTEKTYKAGSGSSWPSQFHDDLTRGVFGKPSP